MFPRYLLNQASQDDGEKSGGLHTRSRTRFTRRNHTQLRGSRLSRDPCRSSGSPGGKCPAKTPNLYDVWFRRYKGFNKNKMAKQNGRPILFPLYLPNQTAQNNGENDDSMWTLNQTHRESKTAKKLRGAQSSLNTYQSIASHQGTSSAETPTSYDVPCQRYRRLKKNKMAKQNGRQMFGRLYLRPRSSQKLGKSF